MRTTLYDPTTTNRAELPGVEYDGVRGDYNGVRGVELDGVRGVELDENGYPIGSCSLEEWIDELGQMLIAHYGEDFRIMLNKSRIELGMEPLLA
jgi:hypothetical protein